MKTLFIGNRFRVLEKMLEGNYEPLGIFAVRDSFLERELNSRAIEYTRIDSKAGLVSMLKDMDYELLVSNGCPFYCPFPDCIRVAENLSIFTRPCLLNSAGLTPSTPPYSTNTAPVPPATSWMMAQTLAR
jgi:hypothetical protein